MANRSISGTSNGTTALGITVSLPAGYLSPSTVVATTTLRIVAAVGVPPALPSRIGLTRLAGNARIEIRTKVNPNVWSDVACQVVSARATWGTQKSQGILSQADPGTLELELYDPDRLLDPTNGSSPYYGVLRPGLWIRLMYGATVVKSGFVDSLAHTISTNVGSIRANDWLSLLANFGYPNEFGVWGMNDPQYATLHAFAAGILPQAWNNPLEPPPPITVEAESVPAIPIHLLASASWEPGAVGPSVWEHITQKATSVLHYAWLDKDSVMRFRDSTYGHQPGIALGVSGPLPLDFIGSIDAAGIYNSIYVPVGDGPAYWTGFDTESMRSVFQWGTKRYTSPAIPVKPPGKYSQLEYGTIIWKDRDQPAFQAMPVRIWPASAAEFNQLISLEAMQTVVMQFDSVTPPVSVIGRAIGEVINVDSDGWSVELSTWIPR